jgi:hypothetical protein
MPKRSSWTTPRVERVLAIASDQGDVVSRRQIYAQGMTRGEVRGHVRAGRWRTIGDQSVCVHTGALTEAGLAWAAVFQGGPRAMLDGASALRASGLGRFTIDKVRVSVPRGARIRRTSQFDIRQTRRWRLEDLAPGIGTPRTQPAVAAVRAGLWAKSDKQAALVVTMAVQQGLVTAEDLGLELLAVRRDRRRLLLHAVINDLLDGARSLGELDVARECTRRGLPRPERQVLRKDNKSRYFLDLYWPDHLLVVEVDGIHHAWAENVVSDALRQNALSLDGDTVLRLPLLGLRLQPDESARRHTGGAIVHPLRMTSAKLTPPSAPGCRRWAR